MQATTKISGKVTLENKVTNALKGLQIDLFDTNPSIGWLAGTKIKANGGFNFSINQQATPPKDTLYQFKVSKKGIVLHQFDIAKGKPIYNIEISLASYEKVISNLIPTIIEMEDYFIVKGKVLSFQNQTLVADVIFYEGIYKNKIQIASTISNAKGYFEIKLSSKLFTNERTDCKRSLIIEAEISNRLIASSGNIFISGENIEIDLKSNLQDIVPEVEFIKIQNAINIVTNNDNSLKDIVELNETFDELVIYLSETTCIDKLYIKYYLLSLIFGKQFEIKPDMIFALFIENSSFSINTIMLINIKQQKLNLETAKLKNIVSFTSRELETFVEKSIQFKTTHFLNKSIKGEDVTNGQLFSTIFSSDAEKNKFFKVYFHNKDNNTELWQDLRSEFNDSQIEEIKTGIMLITFCGCQPQVLSQLFLLFKSNPKDLARKNLNSWKQFIKDTNLKFGRICIPNTFSLNDDLQNRIDNYAAKLLELAHYYYPVVGLQSILQEDKNVFSNIEVCNDLITFFETNPTYTFQKNGSINSNMHLLEGVSNELEVLKELNTLERLANITNATPSNMIALRKSNITSAFDVSEMDEESFVNTFGQRLGVSASAIYGASQRVVGIAGHATADQYTSRDVKGMEVFNVEYPWYFEPVPTADANLATLFGSLDACCCDHCRSVYSPTAYFTDVLNMLYRDVLPLSSESYLELDRRRPDLKHIDLTCVNANTPMPYIDLVN